MSTPDPILTQAAADRALALLREALSLLKGVEGPEQGLVAATAEQAKRQGAAEDSRERGRVAPVEAQAALRAQAHRWLRSAAEAQRRADHWNGMNWGHPGQLMASEAASLKELAEYTLSLLPEPESEADAPASTPTGETPTEAHTSPPTDDERSGRRNSDNTRP